jgi:hypothetical protein
MESDTVGTQAIENRSNFVARLFNGDISLPITYWVFVVLIGNFAFQIVDKIIEFNYVDIITTETGSWSVMAFYWVAIGYTIFMLIATWRSAGKFKGNAIWGRFARFAVVLGTLVLVGNFITGFQQDSDTEFALTEEIKMINKSLPTMIDKDTRLDHVSIQDRDVYYNYTFVNWSVENLDITQFTSVMTPKLKTGQCAEEEGRALLNEGRKIVYMYRGRGNKPVAKIVVEKSDCL